MWHIYDIENKILACHLTCIIFRGLSHENQILNAYTHQIFALFDIKEMVVNLMHSNHHHYIRLGPKLLIYYSSHYMNHSMIHMSF